jgi:mannose-6-phosphate isomerase-like protein (cupin superfamily)
MKKVKIVTQNDVEAKIPYEGVFSKRIMTKIKDGSDKMSFNHCVIKAGWEQPLLNADNDEIIYFIDGKAIISFDNKNIEVSAGSCVYVPAGVEYKYIASEDATMVCVYSPPAE